MSVVEAQILVPTSNGFERHTGDKVLFGQPEPEEIRASEPIRAAARGPTPRADVLRAIHITARAYQDTPTLRRLGITPRQWRDFFQANIEIESAYNAQARSHVGAYGLGQLMPETAAYLRVNMYNMQENLDGSARYLLEQLETFGSMELALAAYNAGPGAVQRYNGIPPFRETRNHVRKVMAVYARLQGEQFP